MSKAADLMKSYERHQLKKCKIYLLLNLHVIGPINVEVTDSFENLNPKKYQMVEISIIRYYFSLLEQEK